MRPEWFAGRLRELRESAGLSRQQLADLAGMKLGGVRDLEQGVRKPSWETVVALCKALKVGCDQFLQEPGDLPPPQAGRPRKADTPAATPSTPRAGSLETAAKKRLGRRRKGQ